MAIFFLSCAKDGDVNLIRTDTCERVGTYAPPGEKSPAISAVDITFDSKYVVTAGADGRLCFYTFDGELIYALVHGGILKFVEFNQKPGEQNMVVTCNDKFKGQGEVSPNRIMVWGFDPSKRSMGGAKKLSSKAEDEPLLVIDEDLPMKATKVKWGAFDETLISIFEEGTVIIWNAETGKKVELIQAHTSPVTSLNFSQDRMVMITASKDMTAKLWAMDKLECIQTYKTDRPLNDATISPLYDDKSNPKMHVLLGGGQDAKDVTTTGSGAGKFEALLWHMVYEEEIGSVKGHFGPLNTISWLQDGRGFITGGEDGYVRVHHFDPDYFTSKKFE